MEDQTVDETSVDVQTVEESVVTEPSVEPSVTDPAVKPNAPTVAKAYEFGANAFADACRVTEAISAATADVPSKPGTSVSIMAPDGCELSTGKVVVGKVVKGKDGRQAGRVTMNRLLVSDLVDAVLASDVNDDVIVRWASAHSMSVESAVLVIISDLRRAWNSFETAKVTAQRVDVVARQAAARDAQDRRAKRFAKFYSK